MELFAKSELGDNQDLPNAHLKVVQENISQIHLSIKTNFTSSFT